MNQTGTQAARVGGPRRNGRGDGAARDRVAPRFCAEDDCPNKVEAGEYLCPRHGEIEERRMGWSVVGDALGTFAVIAAVLMLGGCGTYPDPASAHPAEPRTGTEYPRPPAPTPDVLEVCTVTLHDDGTVSCTCEVAK